MLTLFRERYEVLGTLGAGGEARVVKALDRQHDRVVALKIRPAGDDAVREDLLSEARVLLSLPPHPALPLVREDFFDRDDYVVAMDWVDGTDLATLLGDRGRPGLAASSVLAYLAQAAFPGSGDVLLDDGLDVARTERVEIEDAFNGYSNQRTWIFLRRRRQ